MPEEDEDMNGIVKAFLSDWAKPAAAALCVAVGLYYRMQWDLDEIKKHGMVNHARQIEETRDELTRKSRFGPDGFLDPEMYTAHDAHLDSWAKRRGIVTDQVRRDYWRRVAELNPTFVIPKE